MKGEVNRTSLTFPTVKSPVPPLEDHQSGRTSQLETGRQFTRHGTFLNNAVVPIDRCDDPSFFSGLSNSNTPETTQTKPDEEKEFESKELPDETEDDDFYFNPIVQLPRKVEFESGEEDEDVVFEERAKLFRFDSEVNEWKERGIGNIKLLRNSKSGKARILMRREKVHKICANHFLTEDMTLKPGKGSDKSWVWSTVADLSDEAGKTEHFAAKFKTRETAEAFKAKFEEMQPKKSRDQSDSSALSPHPTDSESTINVTDHQKARSLAEMSPCLSSTPSKPGQSIVPPASTLTIDIQSPSSVNSHSPASSSQSSPTRQNKFPFSTDTYADPKVIKQNPNAGVRLSGKNLYFPSSSPNLPKVFPGSFPHPTSLQQSMSQTESYQSFDDDSKEGARSSQLSEFRDQGTSSTLAFQPKFQTMPKGAEGMSTFSFTFSGKQESPSKSSVKTERMPGADPFDLASRSSNHNEGIARSNIPGIFGMSSKGDSLSFKELASRAGDINTFQEGMSTGGKSFTGFGRQLFTEPDNEREDNERHEDEASVDFKPIVSLPLVKNRVTGEEGETIRFSKRAKLFRFDKETKQWKERGTGEIKLLYNPSTGKSRVVMRREQVHKLCANHVILASMKLKANATSDRSWLWHTPADISDGEPKAEQLAVRFKQEETASEFKKTFEELQSMAPASKSSDPDADLDTSANKSPLSKSNAVSLDKESSDLEIKLHSTRAGDGTPKQSNISFGAQPNFSFGSGVPTSASFRFGAQTTSKIPEKVAFPFSSEEGSSQYAGFSFGTSHPPNLEPGRTDSTFAAVATKTGSSQNGTTPNSSTGFKFGSQAPSKQVAYTGLSFPVGLSLPNYKTTLTKGGSDFGGCDKTDASGRKDTDEILFTDKSGSKYSSDAAGKESKGMGFSFPSLASEANLDVDSKKPLRTSDLKTQFQPAKGSWECETCLIRNTEQAVQCVACQTPKPGAQPVFAFGTNFPSTGFTFGSEKQDKENYKPGFTFPPSASGSSSSQKTTFIFGSQTPDNEPNKASFMLLEGKHKTTLPERPGFVLAPRVPIEESGIIGGESSSLEKNTNTAVSKNDIKLKFQPAKGSWECETCWVQNTEQANSCIACQAAKPGSDPSSQTNLSFANKPVFNFRSSVPTSTPFTLPTRVPNKEADKSGFTFLGQGSSSDSCRFSDGTNQTTSKVPETTGLNFPRVGGLQTAITTTAFTGFTFGTQVPSKEVPELIGGKSFSSYHSGFVFGSLAQNDNPSITAAKPSLTSTASASETSLSQSPAFVFGSQASGKEPNKNDFTSFGNKTDATQTKPAFVFGARAPVVESGETNISLLTSKTKSSESDTNAPNTFLDLSAHTNFTFCLDLPKTDISYPTQSPASSPSKHFNEEEENPEKEDEKLFFKPIVSLPKKIDFKTGEEDELIKFCNRAKLYRFHEGVWKERGEGEIKILYDPRRKRGRVVMRRDQVRVLCANHYISNDMILKPHGPSQRCWMWHVTCDIADNEVKEQLFSVKFKDAKIALSFKNTFEECVNSEGSMFGNTTQTDDDLMVVHEKCASLEQRDRAAKLLLPANFYAEDSQVTFDVAGLTTQNSSLKKDPEIR